MITNDKDFEKGWNSALCSVLSVLRERQKVAAEQGTKNAKRQAAFYRNVIRLVQIQRMDLPLERKLRYSQLIAESDATRASMREETSR